MKRSFLCMIFLSSILFSFGVGADEKTRTCSEKIKQEYLALKQCAGLACSVLVGAVRQTSYVVSKINKDWHKQMYGHVNSSDEEDDNE